jgi:16S rRNA (cytidine1402-2'-O)-methyltransferase
LGFAPRKAGDRRHWLARAASSELPVVVFEAPHRLRATLSDALEVLGNRPVVVCRELTKMHEEVIRTTLEDAVQRYDDASPMGEFTLVIREDPVLAHARRPREAQELTVSDEAIWSEVRRLTNSGASRRDAVALLAKQFGRSSRDVYAAAERGKALARTP